MAALNLTEATGQTLKVTGRSKSGPAEVASNNFRAHVYALLALRIRHSLPSCLNFLARFYMFKGKAKQRKNEKIDANLAWLFSKAGQKFAFNFRWRFGMRCSSLLTLGPDTLNPLALVGRYFRNEQLSKALAIIVAPGDATGPFCEALEAVKCAESNNSSVDIGVLKPCQDPVSRWWAAILATAAHWNLDQKDEADKLYQAVEAYPVSITSCKTSTSPELNRSPEYIFKVIF